MDDKEKLFCYYMSELYNGREAAIKAGYPAKQAETQAALLMMKPKNRDRINKFREENRCGQLRDAAVQGLLRLAFGSVGDAVKLLREQDETAVAAEDLDLFHVAELKRPKGGGWEVRLLGRLDALRMLLELSGGGEGEAATGPSSIYSALEQAARTISANDLEQTVTVAAGDMDAV